MFYFTTIGPIACITIFFSIGHSLALPMSASSSDIATPFIPLISRGFLSGAAGGFFGAQVEQDGVNGAIAKDKQWAAQNL